MKKIVIGLFCLNLSNLTAKFIDLHSSELLFKSSFEEGVYLKETNREGSSIWWQGLEGSDNDSFEWPIKLQGEEGQFQMIVHDDEIDDYIENELKTVIGIDGEESRVLHQKIKNKEEESTQDPYVVITGGKEQKKLYIRYALKFPSNLADILETDGWLAFCEYKTASDYRLAFYIYQNEKDDLYWYVHGDNMVLDDRDYEEYWSLENRKYPIKAGEWQDIEIYWNRDKNNGQVWMAVDGDIIFNYKGSTKLKESIEEMMLFTNYANKPLEQWVDNVEIWNNFPCGFEQSCHN